jgi:ribosome-associated translation inhibitor RaiA
LRDWEDYVETRAISHRERVAVQIQINTGRNVEVDDLLTADVEAAVASAIGRFGERITRVEIHLSDENADKGGRDTRCLMEARVAGLPPIAVDVKANSTREAVRGAAGKLERALDSRLGRAQRR